MDINNYDYLLRNVVLSGIQVKAYEDKYERTDYMYCIDNGFVYDEENHQKLGYKLEACKDIYIKDLENYVNFICENNDIDLDDLKLY
ncbi:hypothetical protein, partial [Agathobacter sp.]